MCPLTAASTRLDRSPARSWPNIRIVLGYPSLKLAIAGNTDSVGTEAFNQQLSEQRVEGVRAYLTQPESSTTATGFGKTRPFRGSPAKLPLRVGRLGRSDRYQDQFLSPQAVADVTPPRESCQAGFPRPALFLLGHACSHHGVKAVASICQAYIVVMLNSSPTDPSSSSNPSLHRFTKMVNLEKSSQNIVDKTG
jgi:hypothetical protein